jgi:uracil-DNA glycosylase family 4
VPCRLRFRRPVDGKGNGAFGSGLSPASCEEGAITYVGLEALTYDGVLVVGEAPGPEEHRQRQLFVGPSGQLLRRYLKEARLYDCSGYSNIVRHWPHEGRRTRKPTDEETEADLPRIHHEIELLQPRLVIAVGETAGRALGMKGTIGQGQGKLFQIPPVPQDVKHRAFRSTIRLPAALAQS